MMLMHRSRWNDSLATHAHRRAIGRWLLTSFVAVTLVATGCTAQNTGKGDSNESAAKSAECLTEVDGTGELEVTDSVFTTLNPNAEGDYKITYAVEVTNNSKNDTAMVAGMRVEFVDGNGEPVASSNPTGASGNVGRFEYVAPGERKYFAGAFTDGFTEIPADMEIELPHSVVKDKPGKKTTYWWSDKDVDYPEELDAGNVEVSDDGSGGKQLRFDVENSSDRTFKNVEVVTILRDDEGDLLGGQYSGPSSAFAIDLIEVPPGQSEIRVGHPFRNGIPSDTDPSKIEIQITNSSDWTKLDEDCLFQFDPGW